MINLLFYIYNFQVSKLLKEVYCDNNDIILLNNIIQELSQIKSVYDFIKDLSEETND
ncbi:hypothetical protein GCM10008906_16330 [Clostridium oceanicum]|uniref:Uncharacterized protein n=1 Tax=Clostridium oceanicum TaxID=1543 RepID=A0ABN1JFR5_9CLOT